MSKSIGNVFNPIPYLEKYSADPLRYFCLAKISPFTDGDFSLDKLTQTYNSDLANGLGNLVSRVATLCHMSSFEFIPDPPSQFRHQVKDNLENFRFDLALADIWQRISLVDKLIEKEKPWTLKGQPLKIILTTLVAHIRQIAFELQPFLPETAEKIDKHFYGPKITPIKPLFPRIS
jgi:methionyl-tRNA synthetase